MTTSDTTINAAPPCPPQTFRIHPSNEATLLLYGWQRAYAEFEVQWSEDCPPFRHATHAYYVRQALFEASDGQWIMVETTLEGNIAKRHDADYRHCDVWRFDHKNEVSRAPCRHRQHLKALYAQCGIPYEIVIGNAKGERV
jgi:hypothetical protein